ncbi:hypothetical protein CK203_113591 [Vitis vinifera]|uniref:Uncharacterized protein n=2 Tax=Vitis vinifera TaxID=29760 RepID=A0A438CCU0_VITVI|nr:hypothetical protein CK203_113591 [Vitis vinifera]CAN68356.1 hypothetical protein VITISV_040050 [Vitis vinifera]
MAHNNDDLFKQANKYSKQRKSLYFVVEKLIRVRHLKQPTQFDDLSLCNAIKGRPWLHKMKVIPSMYHQMVSYLTEVGQTNLLGSQLAMRQCYQVALESRHPVDDEEHPQPSNARKQ